MLSDISGAINQKDVRYVQSRIRLPNKNKMSQANYILFVASFGFQ